MKLMDVVHPACVLAKQSAQDKADLLERLATLAKAAPALESVSQQAILEGLKKREAIGSTGFGHGIAIPHCRLKGIEDFVVGILTLEEGVDFDALDQQPVQIIVFMIAPEAKTDLHIHLLSAISQVLHSSEIRAELLKAPSNEALYESFLRHRRGALMEGSGKKRSFFQVVVQEEKIFREILEVLSSLEPESVLVLEGQNTGTYLSSMPLFAGLWADDARQFTRVILAAVDQSLCNEAIRRLESVTGALQDRRDVMVAVQDLSFFAGAIRA